MQVRELLTKWGFQIEHEKLDRTEKQLDSIKHALEFLAATEIARGIYELGEKWAHFAEELHIAATAAGLGVEAFQKLSGAAKLSGVSQEEMSGALAKLGRHLYDARNGSEEALMAFAHVGFTSEQVRGFHTTSDAMKALADRVKSTNDPIAKQAMLMSLLGRGSFNMVEFLNKGSAGIKGQETEMGRLGVLSERQVTNLVRLEHAFLKIWQVTKYLASAFASNLAPSIEYLVNNFVKLYEANKKWIDIDIRAWSIKAAFIFGFIWGLIEDGIFLVSKLVHWFMDFSTAHPVLMKLMFSLGLMVISVLAVKSAVEKLFSVFGALKGLISVLLSPAGLLVLALIGIFIAVHDIIAALQGKKTWIQGFLEWLGVAQQVEDVMFSIFTIVEDLLNLDFSKLKSDALGAITDLGKFAIKTAATFLPGGSVTSPPQIPANTNVASNAQTQINAPITVNVPPGADPQVMAQKVREGVKDHLDRVHREAQRSLRPVQAY